MWPERGWVGGVGVWVRETSGEWSVAHAGFTPCLSCFLSSPPSFVAAAGELESVLNRRGLAAELALLCTLGPAAAAASGGAPEQQLP